MSCGTRAQHSARAILMAPGSSVPSLWIRSLAYCWYCSVACHSATLRQPAPSPVLRLLWLRTPLPDIPVRAPAADAFTEVLLPRLHCSRRPLITAGHPVRSSVPSPSCESLASKLHHRTALRTTTAVLLPASSSLPGPVVSLATRKTITRPKPNVYCGRHRFPRVAQ